MDNYTAKVIESVAIAKKQIDSLRTEDTLVFPLFTDLHTADVKYEYTQKLITALKIITQEIDYDALINLGDNFSMLGRSIHITDDELKKRFESLFCAISEATDCHPMINVNGNHDALGTDFFKPDFWNSIVKGKYGNTHAIYGNEGAYYYIDYEKANTRLVALSIPSNSDIESEMPTPIWKFGKPQIEWLKKIALNTDKNIIILSHVPFWYKYTDDTESTLEVWNGTEVRKSYVSALCGWIEDSDAVAKIIEEFNNGASKVVACLSGHTHSDSLLLPFEEKFGEKNPLPCCQIVTTAACFTRNVALKVGIGIDIAVYTPSKGELQMIRIGDGENRKVTFSARKNEI